MGEETRIFFLTELSIEDILQTLLDSHNAYHSALYFSNTISNPYCNYFMNSGFEISHFNRKPNLYMIFGKIFVYLIRERYSNSSSWVKHIFAHSRRCENKTVEVLFRVRQKFIGFAEGVVSFGTVLRQVENLSFSLFKISTSLI